MEDYEIFAERVEEASFDGGVVRLNLYSVSPDAKGTDNRPALVFKKRVAMPLEGFLRSMATMQGLLDKLEKGGVIKKRMDGPFEKDKLEFTLPLDK